jgi:hypothetical protein
MNRRNTDELIHDFVVETRDELPERVYGAVRHEIDHSPQRIVLGPWRTPFMNNASRYALPAFVVALIAVLAIASLNVFGFKSSPLPGASQSPSPTHPAVATPVSLDVTNRGDRLAAGTYSVKIPSSTNFTFSVPDGWTFDDLGSGRIALYRTTTKVDRWDNYLLIDSVKSVYADPCKLTAGATSVDQSVAAITEALTHQAHFTASAPTAAQLPGATGQTFTIDINDDAAAASGPCTGVEVSLWRDWSDFNAPSGSNHQRLWVLDTGHGNPVAIEVMGYPWTSAAEQEAAENVVTSMKFE